MILLLLAFFLDNLLSNYFPYTIKSITWFQPCFFVVFLVYLYFKVKKKDTYLKEGLIYIVIGSLIFGNSIILRLISFLLIFMFLSYFTKKYNTSIKLFILSLIISLFIHFYSSYLVSLIFMKTSLSFLHTFFLFSHYILFNIIFGICFYYFFGIKRKNN